MAHTKNYLAILCFLFFLVSCNDQKKQRGSKDVSSSPAEAVHINNEDGVNTATLHNAFTSSITQTFIVKQKNITILTGKKGLKVTVKPSALETEDGQPVSGDIVVKMVELTTGEDLFKSNAATMSNGRLLASGGSYFIGMECNGKKLRLKNNQSLQMEFPKIKEDDMELFYGNKNETGDINWVSADEQLNSTTNYNAGINRYASYNPPYPDLLSTERKRFKSKYRLYNSINGKVYFENKLTTLKGMIDILQKRGVDKNIDTLFIPSYEYHYGLKYDPKYQYDTVVKYRIISCKDLEAERDSLAKEASLKAVRDQANRKYNEAWWKKNDDGSLEGRLQQYYAPSAVTRLGWINCDRFYQYLQNIETPVEIPYTFTNSDIQYFLIYKSFNGLMSGKLVKNTKQQFVLSNLPYGEKVTLVAFTKQNGQVYNCRQDFVITPGKTIVPAFKTISAEQMNKMFGSNIKI